MILENVTNPFIAITPGPVLPGVALPFRVTSVGQTDLFANYLYYIGILDTI